MLHGTMRQSLVGFATALAMTTTAVGQTEVNVVAFAPGFAWANLFGASGTEKSQFHSAPPFV